MRARAPWLGLPLLLLSLGACRPPAPPVAKLLPKTTTLHGETLEDPYHWLRDRKSPEVLAHLRAENRHTEAVMAPTRALQDELFREMVARIQEDDAEVPERQGDYFYYSRTEKGKQYRIHCRKKGSLEAAEEVILDENELAQRQKYLRLGVRSVSPDHRILAFSTDTDGSERYLLRFKDLQSGKILPDAIPNTGFSAAWSTDNQTVFYTITDHANRPFKLLLHRLGDRPEADPLLYHETDEAMSLGVKLSRSQRMILLSIESLTTSEVRFLDAAQPSGSFALIQPRTPKVLYDVEHHGDRFLLLVDDLGKNFRLVEAPVASPGKESWKEILPHRREVKLDQILAFERFLVVFERQGGLPRIRVIELKTGARHMVSFEEPTYELSPSANPEFRAEDLRFVYQSLVTPKSVFDYHLAKRSRTLRKRDPVLGGYDPARYRMERIFARSPDGTQVPISIVYRQGFLRDGSHPLYLYGYGAYGYSYDPSFQSPLLSLLDRGWAVAIAHVRGGGEMGKYWHEDGRMGKKKNTFLDFIASAEHLIRERYTASDRLVATGTSAGGLLMGAVVNLRPDLFRAVVAKVPFVDVLTTMLDPTLMFTVSEFEEWGNPRLPDEYRYLRSYSPYENVEAKAYPNLLVAASLNDPRVNYWEPAKWVARLRARKTDHNLLLFKVHLGAGHRGVSGRYAKLQEAACEYAFLVGLLGLRKE